MKNSLITFILFLWTISFCYAQSMYMVGSSVERSSPLNQMRPQPGPPVGSVYLNNDEWMIATIDLVKGTLSVDQLKDVPIRLDLKTNIFELNAPTGIKVLEGSKVEKFQLVDPKTGITESFFNCNKFKLDGVPLIGFCKITGVKIALAVYSNVKLMRADYNVTLNVGRKEDEFVKNTTLYLVKDNNFLPATKRTLFDLMSDKEIEIKKFIKEKRINTNKEDELRLVVECYDTISGS